MPDISTRADLELLLRHFYARAFTDPILRTAFDTLATVGLDDHLPVMCDFWESVLLGSGSYRGGVLAVHRALHGQHGFTERHFDRWVELWTVSVDDLFGGEVACRARVRAVDIALTMRQRILDPSERAGQASDDGGALEVQLGGQFGDGCDTVLANVQHDLAQPFEEVGDRTPCRRGFGESGAQRKAPPCS